MLTIKDGVISITRGDTAYLDVTLTTAGGTAYTMQEGDTLTLTVRERAEVACEVLLQSTSTNSTIILTSEQTAALPVGNLSYDIQLTTFAGEIYTVVGATSTKTNLKNFVVWPEVTT